MPGTLEWKGVPLSQAEQVSKNPLGLEFFDLFAERKAVLPSRWVWRKLQSTCTAFAFFLKPTGTFPVKDTEIKASVMNQKDDSEIY